MKNKYIVLKITVLWDLKNNVVIITDVSDEFADSNITA
jgi:hypothetical protein